MNPFRLIATDLDGTLLDPTGALSPRTLAALHAAHTAGVVTVLATARRYTGAEPIARAIGSVGAIITFDGAQIRGYPEGTILASAHLKARRAQRAAELIHAHGLRPIAQHSDATGERLIVGPQPEAPEWSRAYLDAVAPLVAPSDLATMCAGYPDPVRVVAFGPAARIHRVARVIAADPVVAASGPESGVGVHVLEAGNYGAAELTVLPAGASKGAALAEISQRFGVSLDQVLALGDGVNDISMFRVAGLSVAMGNAAPGLLRVAHATTASNGEDGAALAIEHYILDRPA
ncbi:MAG TPA: HAD family hydrolase [Ktedonobacterales bacterium]|nr:HAD family hydrolase [Ktedonobacterales bacterium]